MCEAKRYKSGPNPRIDKCIENLMNYIDRDYEVLASCCGHGRYPMTIVVKFKKNIFDIISQENIPRKRKFYKRDSQGYYYIPEVCGVVG